MVDLHRRAGCVVVTLCDDGPAPACVHPRCRAALDLERAEELGGRAEIQSDEQGWRVTAWNPCRA